MDTEDFTRYIPQIYRDGQNIRALFKSYADQFTYEEQQILLLQESIQIDTAKGEDLEKIGSLVRIFKKTGETDDDYRARIKGLLSSIRERTTKQALISTIESAYGLTISDIDYSEVPGIVIFTLHITGVDGEEKTIQDLLDVIKAAGILIRIKWILDRGDFATEKVRVTDSIFIQSSEDDGLLRVEYSEVELSRIPPTDYVGNAFRTDISRTDGNDLTY